MDPYFLDIEIQLPRRTEDSLLTPSRSQSLEPARSQDGLSPEPATSSRQSLSPRPSDGADSSESSIDPSLRAVPSAGQSRKRPAEDMTQFATETARKVKLRPEDRQDLVNFSQLDLAQQAIVLSAKLTKMLERQDEIQPADAVYTMSDSLTAYIDIETFYVITLPTLSAYLNKDEPVNLMIDKLNDKGLWGFPDIKDDRSKMDIVEKRIRNKLNSMRNNIKGLINESLPKPIAQNTADQAVPAENARSKGHSIAVLSEAVFRRHDFRDASGETKKSAPIELMARLAFLRRCYVRFEATKKQEALKSFWLYVDTQLDAARQKFNRDELSQMFWAVLNKDRELYGDN